MKPAPSSSSPFPFSSSAAPRARSTTSSARLLKRATLPLLLSLAASAATAATPPAPGTPPAASAASAAIPVQTFPDGTAVRALSPVPPPGVHPRIFFSPEDLPELRRLATTSPARKAAYVALQKTVRESLDNPTTPEGRVLAAIAAGQTPSDAQFAGAANLSYNLNLAAIDAQIADNADRGRLLGRLLSAYGDHKFRTWKRPADPIGLHNGWDANLCLAYDFLAPWMDEEQRAPVRRYIAQKMQGLNLFTHDWPAHMRMWNWAGLHVYQGWGSLAIEGEDGWDPRLWNQAREISRDFCRYNIHESGALTEDLTYFTLGFQGAGLAMMAMAKRGETEIWATGSNVSKLKYHLANQIHPWGKAFMSHQDGAGDGFYAVWTLLKYMYPTDPIIDHLWRERVGPEYKNFGPSNDAHIRAWYMVLFNTEYSDQPVAPADWNLPPTYFCPKRSYLVTRTDWSADALKLDFEAKTDYPTVGHNHADANNFTFAALGREWATEAGYHGAAGHLHNNVVVDARSQAGWPAPGGRWIDLVDTPEATIGVSDARHAYTWQWNNSGWGVENSPPASNVKWELETLPEVLEFTRLQRESGQGRQTIFEHHGPVIRSEWNPVEKAFRTAALVRGKRPYALIVDDIRKDDLVRHYQWSMQVPTDLELLRTGDRWAILGAKEIPADKNVKDSKPQPDKRRLLVQILDIDLPSDRDGLAFGLESNTLTNNAFAPGNLRKRLVIPARSAEPRFKILLYPHVEGAPLPDARWNEDRSVCELVFPDQTDRLDFAPAAEGRTALAISRDGQTLAALAVPPAAPRLLATSRVFTSRHTIELALPGTAQEIRYTLDGSAPTATSPLYTGPLTLEKDATLKATTFARRWAHGEVRQSTVTEARFTRQTPRPADPGDFALPGLNATLYQGNWNHLPDFAKLEPIARAAVERIALPPETPAKDFGLVLEGALRVPADGVYTLALRCDDAARLWIGDQLVVDHDGQHIVSTKTAEIALAAGLHHLRIEHCDGALALGRGKGDGSWAFQALWAPAGAALQEIPAAAFARTSGPALAAADLPRVAAAPTATALAPGLRYSTYDRTAQLGTASFFDLALGRRLLSDARNAIETPDSAAGVLHVYQGFLRVPHAGAHEFQLDASGTAELTLGDNVVARVGAGQAPLTRRVHLESGPVPLTLKLGKDPATIRWRGPGSDWQPLLGPDLARPAGVITPSHERDLLGHWTAATLEGTTLRNQISEAAGDLVLPEGTRVVDDPVVGRAIALEHSALVHLSRTGILNNAVTVVFRLKGDADCTLVRYGYAHTGIFAGIRNGDVFAGGGRVHNAASTRNSPLRDGAWHHVAVTFGGSPVRQIRVFLDGKLQAEGRSLAPCLTNNLEFLQGFTGSLAEIRLYHRVLDAAEIADLAR